MRYDILSNTFHIEKCFEIAHPISTKSTPAMISIKKCCFTNTVEANTKNVKTSCTQEYHLGAFFIKSEPLKHNQLDIQCIDGKRFTGVSSRYITFVSICQILLFSTVGRTIEVGSARKQIIHKMLEIMSLVKILKHDSLPECEWYT